MANIQRVSLLCVLLLVVVGLTTAQEVDPARAAYESGDYAEAVRLYESRVAAGESSAALYYNLGSAYFESDDLGRALLNFLRAYARAPRDRDVNFAIAQVRGLRVDVQTEESGLAEQVAAATDGILTTAELEIVTLILWAGLGGLALVWIVRPAERAPLRTPIRALAVGWGVLMILLVGRVFVETQRPKAVVTAFEAQVMSGPSVDYLPLYTLYAAAEVRLMDAQGGWVRFMLPDGQQGWLDAALIERVDN